MGEPIDSIPDLKWVMAHLLTSKRVKTRLFKAGVERIDPGTTLTVRLGSAIKNPKSRYEQKHGVTVGEKPKRLSRYERPPVV